MGLRRAEQAHATQSPCFGCGFIAQKFSSHVSKSTCRGLQCNHNAIGSAAQIAKNSEIYTKLNKIGFMWCHPAAGRHPSSWFLFVGDKATFQGTTTPSVAVEVDNPYFNPKFISEDQERRGRANGSYLDPNPRRIFIHQDYQDEYDSVISSTQRAAEIRLRAATYQDARVFDEDPGGNDDYGSNDVSDGLGLANGVVDMDTDENGMQDGLTLERNEGILADDPDGDEYRFSDPEVLAESARDAGHLDDLSETLREWLPILICLDQRKQTTAIKLINKLLAASTDSGQTPNSSRGLGVTNSQQLHKLLLDRMPYKTRTISRFLNQKGKFEEQVVVHWKDTRGLLQAVVDNVQRLGKVTDFSAREKKYKGVRQYSESKYCDRMIEKERELREMEGAEIGGRRSEQEPHPWALLPISIYSDKTMTHKRGINVYPVRILSPLIGTSNIARRDASLLWGMLPVLSKGDKNLFLGMLDYLRGPACWWVLKKAFEVLLDPLREYSKKGVMLSCYDEGGVRIERRFFPFVLYSIADIEEDWMHGCISGVFHDSEYRADPRILAKVSDHDSLRGDVADAEYPPRVEHQVNATIRRLRDEFHRSFQEHGDYSVALDAIRGGCKGLSLNNNMVTSPEIINGVLSRGPSTKCKFTEWIGREPSSGEYTYARALTFSGFSSNLGVDGCQVSAPDWLHVGIEGIGKQILSDWLPLCITSNSTINTMNKVLALASWFPHTYKSKTNLPSRGFSVLSDPAMLWAVHRVGLLQVARIAFLADNELRMLVPVVRDLMRLNHAVKVRRQDDVTVNGLKELVRSLLENYHKAHHHLKDGVPVRKLKPFLLLSYHLSIKEIGPLELSNTAHREADHTPLKRETNHTNNHNEKNEASFQMLFVSYYQQLLRAELPSASTRTSRHATAMQTRQPQFEARSIGVFEFTAVDSLGTIAINAAMRSTLDRLSFPQEAVDNFNGPLLKEFLGLPHLSKLESVYLRVEVYAKVICPVKRDSEHGLDCVNLDVNVGTELDLPEDEEDGDDGGNELNGDAATLMQHDRPWTVLQLVHPTEAEAPNEFGKILAFCNVSGTYAHTPRGSDRQNGSIENRRLVVLRMFDAVESSPENQTDIDDTGCPMYRFRQATNEQPQYVMRDLGMIFSPSLFIPHPADRTGTRGGQDGGTTKRRFFHLPECDLRCPLDTR